MNIGSGEVVAIVHMLSTGRGKDANVDAAISMFDDAIHPYQASVRRLRQVAVNYGLPDPFPAWTEPCLQPDYLD